jgi:hypothetical protein
LPFDLQRFWQTLKSHLITRWSRVRILANQRSERVVRIEIHFDVLTDQLYLSLFFMKLVEILKLCLVMRTIALTKIWNRNKLYYRRYSVVLIIKWVSIWQLVPVLFRVSRSPGNYNCSGWFKIGWWLNSKEYQSEFQWPDQWFQVPTNLSWELKLECWESFVKISEKCYQYFTIKISHY